MPETEKQICKSCGRPIHTGHGANCAELLGVSDHSQDVVQNYPEFGFAFDHVGFYNESGERISTLNVVGDKHNLPAEVPTGKFLIAGKEREIGTRGIWGCMGIIIEGETANAMLHLTPDVSLIGDLGYMNEDGVDGLQLTMKELEENIDVLGKREELTVVLIVNKDRRGKSREHFELIKEMFMDLGINKVRIKEIDLLNANLYYTPVRAGEVLAVGKGRSKSEIDRKPEAMVIKIVGQDELID